MVLKNILLGSKRNGKEIFNKKLHICKHQQLEAAGSYFQSSKNKIFYVKYVGIKFFYEVRKCINTCMRARTLHLS
jgi:hypothetical protein